MALHSTSSWTRRPDALALSHDNVSAACVYTGTVCRAGRTSAAERRCRGKKAGMCVQE